MLQGGGKSRGVTERLGLNEIIKAVNDFVWGPVMLVLLVGTGVFLTLRLGFLPGETWDTP